MRIRFGKGKGKSNTLSCIRADGSCLWTALRSLPAQHDMIHYAAETTLGYQNAFFGLLAAGHDIESFGVKDPATGKTNPLPLEAMQTECLVGLLQMELVSGAADGDFFAFLAMSCEGCGIPAPAISPEQLETMRREIRLLCEQWNATGEGETLEVVFQEAAPL